MDSVEIWVRRCAAQMDEAGLFFGHGTDNALDEAVWLVLHVLEAPLDGSFRAWNSVISELEAVAITHLLQRRIDSRAPLAYLLGEAWFCGLPFKVTTDVLVPRSPLAELILRRFRPWLPHSLSQPPTALDLCTGSGCIGISIAHWMPEWQVDASDLSSQALAVARENAQRHKVDHRVRFHESDLFQELPGRRYQLIVSNPPYVPRNSLQVLPDEYRAEPELGLVSGDDGLDLPLRILSAAADYLEPDGILVCEVGESEIRLDAALSDVALTWIEFEHGGGGIFTMTHQELLEARTSIRAAMERRDIV